MYAEIIDQNLSRIRQDLTGKGLTYERLQDDILDHICCMVEEQMEAGNDFRTSYNDVMSGIGEGTLSAIQHQTLILLDKKFQTMKKTMYVTGLFGSILTIIGAFLKMMHLPGAGILLMTGFFIVALVFLPFYFILSYREQAEKPKLVFPVVGYFALLIILTGALFKIMHWPGAGILITVSIFAVLVGLLPLYIVQIFRRTSTKGVNLAYIVMMLVGLSIVVLLTRINLSKDTVDQLTEMSIENLELSRILEQGTTKLLAQSHDAMVSEKISTITGYADRLNALADQMLNNMLEIVDEPGVPIEKVNRRDYRMVGRDAFYSNGLAEEYKKLAREYEAYLLNVIKNSLVASQIKSELRFSSTDEIKGWTFDSYKYEPLIVIYWKISDLKRAVLNAEYTAIDYLTRKE